MGDPEKAFLRLFKLIKDDFNSRDAVRRHDGLFSDKAPKPEPDDDFPYTTSMTETIPCPRCDEPVSIDSSVCASCKSDLVIKSETVTTNYCSLANRK